MQRALGFTGLFLLLALSAARFAHDLKQLVYPLNDLTPVWVSSKAFIAGSDPYGDLPKLESVWAGAHLSPIEGCADYNCILHKYPMAYPPSALPLLAPFSLLTFPAAVYAYLAGSIVFFLSVVFMLAQQLPLPWSSMRKWYLIALALAFSPIHAGIHHSNLNTLVVSLLVLFAVLLERRPRASGVAIALSMCLKPQVGWLFFVYLWMRKRWSGAIAASAVGALMTAASLVWLRIHHVELLHAYLDSLSRFMPPGGINSFYMASPQKYTMINLQVLAFQFLPYPIAANVVAWMVFLALAATTIFLLRARVANNQSLTLALLSVLTLLPVYQQIYTAAILIFVLYWAMEHWHLAQAKASVMLMLPLLLPLASMTWTSPSLARLVEKHSLSSYFLWNAFLMPHVIWIELMLALLMLSTLLQSSAVADPVAREADERSSQWIAEESLAR